MKLQLCFPHMNLLDGNILICLVLMGSLREVLAFVCDNGKFLVYHKMCDGTDDCGDRSDEEKCSGCLQDAFYCSATQKCFPRSVKCDGVKNCPDERDELHCHSARGISVTTVVWIVLLIVITLYIYGFARYVHCQNRISHRQYHSARLLKLFKDYNSHITCQTRMLIVRADDESESENNPLQGVCTNYNEYERNIADLVAITATENFENANLTVETENRTTEVIPALNNFKKFIPTGELGDGTNVTRHRLGFILEEQRKILNLGNEIPEQEFISAVITCGYLSPTHEQYALFVAGCGHAGVTTRTDAARFLFLAHQLHSGGSLTQKQSVGGLYNLNPDRSSANEFNDRYSGQGNIPGPNYIAASIASNWLHSKSLTWNHSNRQAMRDQDIFQIYKRVIQGPERAKNGKWSRIMNISLFETYKRVYKAFNCPGEPWM